jgi:hypothetical protein
MGRELLSGARAFGHWRKNGFNLVSPATSLRTA